MGDLKKHLSIYIHFPWCVKKCPYCDFNSHSIKDDLYLSDIYYKKLIEDFDNHYNDIQNRKIKSIFIGGGTPSLFNPKHLEKVLNHIKTKAKFLDNIEITLEMNPGTVERDTVANFADIGINRLSIGVQSFQNEKLKTLGRIHNDKNIFTTIEEIHKSAVSNFNIDIMHGLPNQSVSDAIYDLQQAINLNPTHLSWYQLTIEPNTLFAVRNPILPSEEILEEIEIKGKEIISNANFNQYEVSAFSKNSLESIHNKNYWLFGDYIGIGAGAHGKITNLKTNKIKRIWKHKHPKIYTSSNNLIKGESILSKDDLIYEFMLNALRLKNGFNLKYFYQNTFLNINDIEEKVKNGINLGLLKLEDNNIKPTNKGYIYLNNTINLFI